MNVVAIDGESVEGRGYCLLSSSAGAALEQSRPLGSAEVFEWLIGQAAGADRLIVYGLDYDVCHWIKDLAPSELRRLAAKGQCWTTQGDQSYKIRYWPRSMFAVARLVPHGKGAINGFARVTDVAPWGGKGGFLPTAMDWDCAGENVAAEIATMKALRGRFDEDMLPEVRSYNETEVLCLTELYRAIHGFLWEAGFPCPSILLPGAVASGLIRRHRVPGLPASVPPEVVEAARLAFRGGRMQTIRFGHFGRTLHYDMRSAYGYGLLSLPYLDGYWRPTKALIEHPEHWALYRVAWEFPADYPGPLPFAAPGSQGRFPLKGEGWFWSPIVLAARRRCPIRFEVLEGWHQYGEGIGRPFGYVEDLYRMRAALPPEHPGQAILKMLIVSTWGKLAQGPDAFGHERKRSNPLWAGMVTAAVDAALWEAMASRPDQVISAHTDGFFCKPGLGLATSGGLGGWDCSEYDEVLLAQSGRYWARQGEEWRAALQGVPGAVAADLALLAWQLDGRDAELGLTFEQFQGLNACVSGRNLDSLGEFRPSKMKVRLNPGKGRVEQEGEEVYRFWG